MDIVVQDFDYSLMECSDADREFLKGKEQVIKARTAQTVVENGRDLLEAKARVGHGNFMKWVEGAFPWSMSSATKMMQVAEGFKDVNFTNFSQIQKSALYALAAPSTPESAREEAVARAEAGEQISHAEAQELIRGHKELKDELKEARESLAKKPKVVEKEVEKLVVPSDYEGLVREKARLEGEKAEMGVTVASLKKAQVELKKSLSEKAQRELEKLLKDKEGSIEWLDAQITRLTQQYQELDATVGATLAYKDACAVVEQCLLKISFQLQEAFAEYPIPDGYVPKLERFVKDLRHGADALDRFLTTGRLT